MEILYVLKSIDQIIFHQDVYNLMRSLILYFTLVFSGIMQLP